MKIKVSLLTATAVALLAMPALANGPVVSKTTMTKTTTTTMHHVWSFDTIDTNHDGAISKEEWMAAAGTKPGAEKKFDALDKNHDGKLSKTEFAMRHPHRTTREQYHWTKTRVGAGGSSSMPPANNEIRPNDYHPGGADGAGGWTAQ